MRNRCSFSSECPIQLRRVQQPIGSVFLCVPIARSETVLERNGEKAFRDERGIMRITSSSRI